MKYITGIHALNLSCSLETCGDWHRSALQWEHPNIKESETSFYKDYGLESNHKIPEHDEYFTIANTIRALLDLLYDRRFPIAQGMNEDFICNDKYDDEIFNKVYEMKELDYWDEIDLFMQKEYRTKWLKFKQNKNITLINTNFRKKITSNYSEKHTSVIKDFLVQLNNFSDQYVLKGGTALALCYNLNRFSENIDLDSFDKRSIFDFVEKYAILNNYTYRIVKNTNTATMFMLHYGGKNAFGDEPLKIEISHRAEPNPNNTTKINDILVYTINRLASLKAKAYLQRDKIRDLFDLTFIYNNQKDNLDEKILEDIKDVVGQKGLEQFDYLVSLEDDDSIDTSLLKTEFLKMYESLHLEI